MILPGPIPIFFYRRRPSNFQIAVGFAGAVLLSALLGYLQLRGDPRVWWNVLAAGVGGAILYAAILAYLLYRYLPRREARAAAQSP